MPIGFAPKGFVQKGFVPIGFVLIGLVCTLNLEYEVIQQSAFLRIRICTLAVLTF